MGIDAALHIGIHRPRDGKAIAHPHIAQGREADGDEADDVDERGHALGLEVHQTVNGMRGDDDHEEHAVQDDVAQSQPSFQFLLVAELLDARSCADGFAVLRHANPPPMPMALWDALGNRFETNVLPEISR